MIIWTVFTEVRRVLIFRRTIELLVVVVVVAAVVPARAQQVQRIAAIVNDEVISMFDLVSRLRMVIASTRTQDSPQARRRYAPQVLKRLIDERLQLQEAKRRNVSVSKLDLKRAVTSMERRNNVPAGEFNNFMRRVGIDAQTFLDQERAGIAWGKLVRRRLRPQVNISDEEIEEVLNRLKASQGQDEFLLAEIFVSFDAPDEEIAAKRTADRLVGQVREGARFNALARQFSHSATAAVGGDLGWIRSAELDPKTLPIVSSLAKGQVTDPVRTVTGFRIYLLREKRKIAAKGPGETVVVLKQIFFPLLSDATPDETRNQIDLAKTVGGAVDGCKDLDSVAKEVRSPRPANLGKFAYSELSNDIRVAIDGLPLGKASKPVKAAGGIRLLMVCERNEPKFELPSRPAVMDRLINRRLELMARRYLRDLRRAAIVDVRT
jgi:peptidyl-prolyl cis-trans isomerase SurA